MSVQLVLNLIEPAVSADDCLELWYEFLFSEANLSKSLLELQLELPAAALFWFDPVRLLLL